MREKERGAEVCEDNIRMDGGRRVFNNRRLRIQVFELHREGECVCVCVLDAVMQNADRSQVWKWQESTALQT